MNQASILVLSIGFYFVSSFIISYYIRGGISIDTLLDDARSRDGVITYTSSIFVLGFLITHFISDVSLPLLALSIGLINLFLTIAFSRFRSTNILGFVVSVCIATAVMYLLEQSSSTRQYNLEDIMFIAAVVFLALQNPTRYFDQNRAYTSAIERKYKVLYKKYSDTIDNFTPDDNVLRRIITSVLIAEDMNRPKLFRLLELPLLAVKKPLTLGIMQVSTRVYISDKKSLEIASNKITGSYLKRIRRSKSEYNLVKGVAADYNGGAYPEIIVDIYFTILEAEA